MCHWECSGLTTSHETQRLYRVNGATISCGSWISVTLREGDVWYYGGQTKRCISWRHLFLGRSSDNLLLKTDIHTSILLCFAFFLLSHSLKKSPDFGMMKKKNSKSPSSFSKVRHRTARIWACLHSLYKWGGLKAHSKWEIVQWTKSPGLELLRHIQLPMVEAASCGQLGRLSKGSWTWEIWNVAYRK